MIYAMEGRNRESSDCEARCGPVNQSQPSFGHFLAKLSELRVTLPNNIHGDSAENVKRRSLRRKKRVGSQDGPS